jgi:hypothetical protein
MLSKHQRVRVKATNSVFCGRKGEVVFVGAAYIRVNLDNTKVIEIPFEEWELEVIDV